MSAEARTFVLLPGAGGESWYWHLVAARLRDRGHEVVSPDLPTGDDGAGLADYAEAALDAIGDRKDLVVVAQSMAAFFHDVPKEIVDETFARGEPRQSDTPFGQVWPLERWPDVPTSVIAGRRDRLLPVEFMRGLARERLGVDDVGVVDSGHLPALARPDELAELLEAHAA